MNVVEKNVSLILGFFDGVHAGHRAVIKTAVDYARKNITKTVLLTFNNSPAEYFKQKVEYLFPRNKSYEIIKSLGVDYILDMDFAKLANISAEDYLENYLIKRFEPISISTGFNHTFGAGREGNPDFLAKNQEKFSYKYFCAPACRTEDKVISSTLIKEFLKTGKIFEANCCLKSNFYLESEVIKGAKLGRKLGFPTANMIYPKNIVKIPHGVYKARVFDKPAVLNWGIKPTINGKEELLEVHIPDFTGDLYGKKLEIEIIEKIRDEKKFNTLEELKIQIKKDTEECLK